MHEHVIISKKAIRMGAAVLAVGALTMGAAWKGLAAGTPPASPLTLSSAATVSSGTSSSSVPVGRVVPGGRDSYADIVTVVAPAVVTIRTEGKAKVSPTQFEMPQAPDDDFFRQFFGDRFGRGQRQAPRSFKQHGLGSGVIVSPDGYILTNFHVVDGAEEIKAETTDGRSLKAKLVGSDKASDLAVLKIDETKLPAIALGNSDAVSVGDVVLAVGNPLGVGQTVTMGIISAKGRSTGAGSGGYEDFLQTDAPINHGNSGGALVNMKGELVGINSQILSESGGNIGIGFAIPSNMAKSVMEQLRSHGRVTRSQLGVTIQPVTSDLASSLGLKQVGGAVISSVAPGSAAEKAGIKRSDVILSFNGQPVGDTNTLRNRVASTAPGSSADVVIVRDGAEKRVNVKLDEASPEKIAARDGDTPDSADKNALGVAVRPMTPALASRMGAPEDTTGLLVESVSPDSRAEAAGIQDGDIIDEVNRRPVRSIDGLRDAVRQTTDRPLLLLVNRQGHSIFVTVPRANS